MADEQQSFNEEDFYEEGEDLTQTTLSGLNNLCKQVTAMREDIAVEAAALKAKEAECKKLEAAILDILQKNNMQNYSSAYGTFYQIERVSVKLPKGEDKEKFFAYLKDKGIFEDVVHMNSQTFNRFYREEKEIALEEARSKGVYDLKFKMPGVGEETTSYTMGKRK